MCEQQKPVRATIPPRHPYAPLWERLFGGRTVPVRDFWPSWDDASGALCYALDARALTREQQEALVEYLAETFEVPPDEVWDDVLEAGVSVPVDGVVVSFEVRMVVE